LNHFVLKKFGAVNTPDVPLHPLAPRDDVTQPFAFRPPANGMGDRSASALLAISGARNPSVRTSTLQPRRASAQALPLSLDQEVQVAFFGVFAARRRPENFRIAKARPIQDLSNLVSMLPH
jgi:hypothetical protein